MLRITVNISDDVIKEAEALYNTENRSNAIECALKDAIRYKKLQMFVQLKNKIQFDEKAIENIRRSEIYE